MRAKRALLPPIFSAILIVIIASGFIITPHTQGQLYSFASVIDTDTHSAAIHDGTQYKAWAWNDYFILFYCNTTGHILETHSTDFVTWSTPAYIGNTVLVSGSNFNTWMSDAGDVYIVLLNTGSPNYFLYRQGQFDSTTMVINWAFGFSQITTDRNNARNDYPHIAVSYGGYVYVTICAGTSPYYLQVWRGLNGTIFFSKVYEYSLGGSYSFGIIDIYNSGITLRHWSTIYSRYGIVFSYDGDVWGSFIQLPYASSFPWWTSVYVVGDLGHFATRETTTNDGYYYTYSYGAGSFSSAVLFDASMSTSPHLAMNGEDLIVAGDLGYYQFSIDDGASWTIQFEYATDYTPYGSHNVMRAPYPDLNEVTAIFWQSHPSTYYMLGTIIGTTAGQITEITTNEITVGSDDSSGSSFHLANQTTYFIYERMPAYPTVLTNISTFVEKIQTEAGSGLTEITLYLAYYTTTNADSPPSAVNPFTRQEAWNVILANTTTNYLFSVATLQDIPADCYMGIAMATATNGTYIYTVNENVSLYTAVGVVPEAITVLIPDVNDLFLYAVLSYPTEIQLVTTTVGAPSTITSTITTTYETLAEPASIGAILPNLIVTGCFLLFPPLFFGMYMKNAGGILLGLGLGLMLCVLVGALPFWSIVFMAILILGAIFFWLRGGMIGGG